MANICHFLILYWKTSLDSINKITKEDTQRHKITLFPKFYDHQS